jgi:hypothetical protein
MSPAIRRGSIFVFMALALVALGYRLFEARAMTRPGPAVVTAPRAAAVRPPGRRPIAREILAAGLELTAGQRRELESLARAWERDAAPLDLRVAGAQADFDAFMTARQGRVSVAELQERSLALRGVSAELRERRRAHTEASLNVLTIAQREALRGAARASGGAQ